jgi:hypothetical protein
MRLAVRADAGRDADIDPLAVEDCDQLKLTSERRDVAL